MIADIHIPHPHGGRAIPISERQILALRERSKQLETKLKDLEDPLELTEKAVSSMREERQVLADELENERRRYEQLEQEQRELQQEVQELKAEQSKGFWRRLFGG